MHSDAKSSITDFCSIHGDGDTSLLFPDFLKGHEVRRRATTTAVLNLGGPTPTKYVTLTSTLPWDNSPFISTYPVGSDGTVTVVDYVSRVAETTFLTTITVPFGQTAYTSIIRESISAADLEVVGVTPATSQSGTFTTASTYSTSSTSSPDSSPNTTPNNPSSANSSGSLSSGAKIGIGVAIPLIFILLAAGALGWLLCHRKNKEAPPQEVHDGGLPEPTSTITHFAEPKEDPPSYHGLPIEPGGAPIQEMGLNEAEPRHTGSTIPLSTANEPNSAQDSRDVPRSHELNAAQQPHETIGSPIGIELSADQARYEASENPVYLGHELSTQPATPSLAPASPARKPVQSPATSPGPSSSFPPPWDSTGTADYEGK